MDDTQLYIMLQGAVERSKGAATWTDILCGIMRAKEAKVSEAVDALVSHLPLEALMRAEAIADAQFMKSVPPPLPTGKPAQPAAIKAKGK